MSLFFVVLAQALSASKCSKTRWLQLAKYTGPVQYAWHWLSFPFYASRRVGPACRDILLKRSNLDNTCVLLILSCLHIACYSAQAGTRIGRVLFLSFSRVQPEGQRQATGELASATSHTTLLSIYALSFETRAAVIPLFSLVQANATLCRASLQTQSYDRTESMAIRALSPLQHSSLQMAPSPELPD